MQPSLFWHNWIGYTIPHAQFYRELERHDRRKDSLLGELCRDLSVGR